ncbi:molybdenum cofactor sulfurase-like [Sitophilus oryzae]|uniref:Molybdenum cofactor sulfurase-like n=1 Tax=Sitophilus oryzae TaxID=7048 RepID=A0A6J2YVE1_SITOR|nr:molybdenum cofactor sulfurase-like [Sitophilus oryzae]
MSTFEDADKFLDMIERCFVTKNSIIKDLGLKMLEENSTKSTKILSGTLVNIFLYPIKSCGAYSPKTSWQITSTGLKYDRTWMIVNSNGSCVSQKQVKSMCLIKPVLDLENMKLRLKFEGAKEISISLEIEENRTGNSTTFCNSKVCGDKIQGYDCGDDVAEWLSENLKKPGLRLLKQCDRNKIISRKKSEIEDEPPLSLANKAQYLMINSASIRWLKDKIHSGSDHISFRSLANRFRANFLVDFDKPFVENALDRVFFGDVPFKFSGKCTRCQMICIDQDSGNISKEPLQVLSDEFNGNMCFGIYLNNQNSNESRIISIKSRVTGQIS